MADNNPSDGYRNDKTSDRNNSDLTQSTMNSYRNIRSDHGDRSQVACAVPSQTTARIRRSGPLYPTADEALARINDGLSPADFLDQTFDNLNLGHSEIRAGNPIALPKPSSPIHERRRRRPFDERDGRLRGGDYHYPRDPRKQHEHQRQHHHHYNTNSQGEQNRNKYGEQQRHRDHRYMEEDGRLNASTLLKKPPPNYDDQKKPEKKPPPSSKQTREVPRNIDVRNFFGDDETDTTNQLPSMPALSPISFSSSLLYKKTYYPSKETIEKELSDLPPYTPIESMFPNREPARPRTKEPKAVAANRTDAQSRRKNTAQPTSEESTNSSSQYRPEKPLRINSQFPSQLQLQKQRQLEKEQQRLREHLRRQQQRQQQRIDHLSTRNHASQVISQDMIPSPRPLPKGNGITNGVSTRNNTQQQQQQLDHSSKGQTTQVISQEAIPSPRPLPKGNGITNGISTRIDDASHSLGKQEQGLRSLIQEAATEEDSAGDDKSPIHVIEVEIYPGISMVLRGAQETALACERDFCVEAKCLACTMECWCIADAEFVICPTCLVVNPLEQTQVRTHDTKVRRRWGVGLGYIPEMTKEES